MRKEQVLDLEKTIKTIKPFSVEENLKIADSKVGGLDIMPFILDENWKIKFKDKEHIIPLGTPMVIVDFLPNEKQTKSSILSGGLRALSSFFKKIDQARLEKESPIPILIYGSTPNARLAGIANHLGFVRINEGQSKNDFKMLATVDVVRFNFGKLVEKEINEKSFWVQLKYRAIRERKS